MADIICCKGCNDRFAGCHADCEKYEAQCAEHKEFLSKKRAVRKAYREEMLTYYEARKKNR